MAFTQADLIAVQKAVASGERVVKYGDKMVEYRSMDELFKLLILIKKELEPKSATAGRVYVSTGKGY